MEKKQDNTELIAFRMSKKLKAKLDAHCQGEGFSIAAYFRCVVSNLPDALEARRDKMQAKQGTEP